MSAFDDKNLTPYEAQQVALALGGDWRYVEGSFGPPSPTPSKTSSKPPEKSAAIIMAPPTETSPSVASSVTVSDLTNSS